ncbi:hypothetical protein NMY22_g4661 [Coprinellus aureogranulatus]|nr:hypothetical protein NMY22_g4661 [Coprinellus aureogranulatus]
MRSILGVLELFTVYPSVLEPIVAWAHEDLDPIRRRAARAPESQISGKLKQFMVTGVKRADVWWKFRDSKMLFICDSSSVSVDLHETMLRLTFFSPFSAKASNAILLLGLNSVRAAPRHCIAPQPVSRQTGNVTTKMSAQPRNRTIKVLLMSLSTEFAQIAHHRHITSAQRSSGTWYSHRTRAYHEQLLASDFNDNISSFSLPRIDDAAPTPHRHSLITYLWGGGIGRETMAVNYKSKDWIDRDGVAFSQDYVLSRLKSLGRKYVAAMNTMNLDLRLVEGVFPLGPQLHIHLVALLRRFGRQYEVVYSIPRRGYVVRLYHGTLAR